MLTFRPAPPGVPSLLADFAGWRYGSRWVRRRPVVDGVPVQHVFYPQPVRRGADLIPVIGDALARHIESDPSYAETDVVYAHWLWRGGAAALELRRRFGWPVAAIARGSDMHWWQQAHRHCRPHVERVIREADIVLANCHGLRRRAEQLVPDAAGRVEVVYNGCDTARFRPATDKRAIRRALGLPPDHRLLLFVGSVIERKGIQELADAWSRFAPMHPRWRLVVVGRLTDEGLLQQLLRAAPGRTEVVGQVPASQVPRYMQTVDAYVQPSRLEGLANATAEAMATALPVIATDTGGQSEAVRAGVNGWLVPPCDPEALAEALHEMAIDPARAELRGAAARATIRAEFDPDLHAQRLYALLRQVGRPSCMDALSA